MNINRAQRFGRTGYWGNYGPPTSRQTIDAKLHFPGVSTSSNSSWTFSNSHDVPKPRKGRLCGIFLIGAVLIVALSVVAIGGLAFYIGGYSVEKNHLNEYQAKESVGAKRHFSTMEYGRKSSHKHPNRTLSFNAAKPSKKSMTTTTTTTTTRTTTTEEYVKSSPVEDKKIPPKAIIDFSQTMQQLNRSQISRKDEEEDEEEDEENGVVDAFEVKELYETTESNTESDTSSTIKSFHSTEDSLSSVILKKNVDVLPRNFEKSSSNGEVSVVEELEEAEEGETTKDGLFSERITDEKSEPLHNGHARPHNPIQEGQILNLEISVSKTSTESSTPVVNLFPPNRVYSNEPWRPIIPSYRDAIRIRNSYPHAYSEKVFESRYDSPILPLVGVEKDEGMTDVGAGPITFSQESFNKNLKITPEYGGHGESDFFLKLENNSSGTRKVSQVKDFGRPKVSEGTSFVESATDDIITAPPVQSSHLIVVNNDGKALTASSAVLQTGETNEMKKTIDEMPEDERRTEPKESHSVAVTAAATPSSVVKTATSTVGSPSSPIAKMTTRIDKTTPQAATIKAVLKIAGVGSPLRATTAIADNNFVTKVFSNAMSSKVPSGAPTPNATTPVKLTTPLTSEPVSKPQTTTNPSVQNATVVNPFLDDSRSSASNYNFGIPDLPIIKQFHHLDSLFKSFSIPPTGDTARINQFQKYHPRREFGNETNITRFPARTKQTTAKSYRNGESFFVEVSTISPERATRKSAVVRGDVKIVARPVKQGVTSTTETPRLITLLPVRSNVNMMRPLRPRPKSHAGTVEIERNSKMNAEFKSKTPAPNDSSSRKHHFVQDKNGKFWVYYPSYKPTTAPSVEGQKLHIVTPEPKIADRNFQTSEEKKVRNFTGHPTDVPVYNAIENLLNFDHRDRNNGKNESVKTTADPNAGKSKNTSEIVDRIVKIMENIAIATDESPEAIIKVNQTVVNKTTTNPVGGESANASDSGGSTKIFSSHYKLNQAGVPVLTKILNKAPESQRPRGNNATQREDTLGGGNEAATTNDATVTSTVAAIAATATTATITSNTTTTATQGCGNTTKCNSKNGCLAPEKKCNQVVDCPDAADEKNCTCADHLKVQQLHRKLCDGIVDCWDFTDEYNCEWCKDEFLCSNSKMCIKKSQICDGANDCPFGDDEKNCVTISPSPSDAETFNYNNNGYLMVRKNGVWGKLCIDNFESVSLKSKTGWKISDLGRSVCKALTFRDFDKVEKMISVPNEGRFIGVGGEKYYELAYNDASSNGSHAARESSLTFHETDCNKKEVVKVTCKDLECGLRPQATSQWPRIVGGGNAGPGSWPWQAALYREGEFQCGGTLISENWLISAGHCFYHHQWSYWVARLGTLRTTLFLPSPYEQLRHITKIIIHPQYVNNGFINDISLLKLRDPVKLTDYVRPICLPKPQTSIVDGAICTIVGWGQLSEVGWVFPDTLQEVQLPILSTSECRKRTLFLSLYKITDDMFCAGYDRGGRDACLGDSGGPLMCTESDGRFTLYGITSNGYGCARSNRPGVYTKVSKYLAWIHSEIKIHGEGSTASDKKNSSKFGSRKTEAAAAAAATRHSANVTFAPVTSFVSTTTTSSTLSSSSSSTPSDAKKTAENISGVGKGVVETVKISDDTCPGHRCPLGECLPKATVCDGRIECSDGSDEKDCW